MHKRPSGLSEKMNSSELAMLRASRMLLLKNNLERLMKGILLTLAVLLLVSVVQGCSTSPPLVSQPVVFRPPMELMEPAPTQYLLPENQRRKKVLFPIVSKPL